MSPKQETTQVDWLPLVEVTRGPLVENQHYGVAVVADENGRTVLSYGNADKIVFPRSALKPIQALPSVESGATEHYGFGINELAIMCSSHSGEAQHVKVVKSILTRLGLDEMALQCGRHIPLYYQNHSCDGVPPLSTFTPFNNNCSGKHAGFLTHACHAGLPTDHYLQPQHPTQIAVRSALLRILGMKQISLVEATDGCSAPTYALPIVNLASAYAKISNAPHGTALYLLRQAMITHPELVSGSGCTDEILTRVAGGRLFAKSGAEGIKAVGLPSLGVGIAVKIADGNHRAAMAVMLALLEDLNVFTNQQSTQVRQEVALSVTTIRGDPVGKYIVNL